MDHRQVQHAQTALAPLLKPLSLGYAAAMRLRAAAYAKGLKTSSKPKSFCLSVGNISWGGSGKTPLTGQLLDWAAEAGLKAAVLTRGYGGKAPAWPLLVTAGTPATDCGDEPRMLADQHPEAAIIVDPVRKRALAWAEAERPADLYILDDGMQHLAVQRDLNLTLLTPEDLQSGWNRVLPAGSWREGEAALNRADAFLLRIAGRDFPALAATTVARLAKYKKPLFCFDLRPQALTPLQSYPDINQTELANARACLQIRDFAPRARKPDFFAKEVYSYRTRPEQKSPADADIGQKHNLETGPRPYALCTAVGRPDAVRRSALEFTGQTPQREFIFPDHYAYQTRDLADMSRAGLPLVCTAKDAVKLRPLIHGFPGLEILVLQAAVVFGPTLFAGDLNSDPAPDADRRKSAMPSFTNDLDVPEDEQGHALPAEREQNAMPLFRRWLAGHFPPFLKTSQ